MWWRLIFLFVLVACAQEPPPPGEVIGTFDFVATLEPTGACALEDIDGIPERLSFAGTLSHDREEGRAWLRSGGSLLEGKLHQNKFFFQTPATPPGVPREFAACTVARRQPCIFAFTELIEGTILGDCDEEGGEGARVDPSELPCPETQEDGTIRWHNCACILGTFEEEARFQPGEDETCTCEGRSKTDTFEGECRLTYRLIGRKN